MGREVRMVPENYEHPKDENGNYKALYADWFEDIKEWNVGNQKWKEGLKDDWNGGWEPKDEKLAGMSFAEWHGGKPDILDYMPAFKDGDKTHYMMFETCSEGTPISPAFDSPEGLALWLTAEKASAFGSQTASYEGWLRIAKGGYACSAIMVGGKIKSGVEGLKSSE